MGAGIAQVSAGAGYHVYLSDLDLAKAEEGKAGIAKAAGDDDARIENLELAIESMHNALAIYAEVASETGDAGAIARLNEQAYTPLLEALEE
jgi:3-hydroxyacyl-CoA dehydrogenase